MDVTVELFGIPRQRAGVAEIDLRLASDRGTLQDLFDSLAEQYPQLEAEFFDRGSLRNEFAVNLDGERFVRDLTTPLRDGQRVLLLSADAGG